MKILYVTLFVVLSDQFTKLLVKGVHLPGLGLTWKGMPSGSSIPILGDLVKLTFIENPGMAFGIDVGNKLFLTVFTIIASLGILIYLYSLRKEKFLFRFSLALILGGAMGNLIDRVFYGVLFKEGDLFYGKVVDFIDIDFFNINFWGIHLSRWPVFNIADSAVTVGVCLLIIFHRSFVKEDEQAIASESTPSDSPTHFPAP